MISLSVLLCRSAGGFQLTLSHVSWRNDCSYADSLSTFQFTLSHVLFTLLHDFNSRCYMYCDWVHFWSVHDYTVFLYFNSRCHMYCDFDVWGNCWVTPFQLTLSHVLWPQLKCIINRNNYISTHAITCTVTCPPFPVFLDLTFQLTLSHVLWRCPDFSKTPFRSLSTHVVTCTVTSLPLQSDCWL